LRAQDLPLLLSSRMTSQIEFECSYGQHRIGETTSFDVTVRNLGSCATERLVLSMQDNGYYGRASAPVGVINAFGSKLVNIRVPARRFTIEDLVADFTLVVATEAGRVVGRRGYSMDMLYWYNRGLIDFARESFSANQPPTVLIFGTIGSGKSSFLQTIMTMMTAGRDVKTNALEVRGRMRLFRGEPSFEWHGPAGGKQRRPCDAGLAPSRVCRHALLGHLGHDCPQLRHRPSLADRERYADESVGPPYRADESGSPVVVVLWIGELPSGWKMTQSLSLHSNQILQMSDSRAYRQPHATIIILSHAALHDEDMMDNLQVHVLAGSLAVAMTADLAVACRNRCSCRRSASRRSTPWCSSLR
jgi:hypothetical protein